MQRPSKVSGHIAKVSSFWFFFNFPIIKSHEFVEAREFDEADNTEEADEIDHLPPPMAAASLPSRKKRHSVTYNAAANYVDAIQSFDVSLKFTLPFYDSYMINYVT